MANGMTVSKKTVWIGVIGILFVSLLFSFAVAADRGRVRTETTAQVVENMVSYVIDSVQITEDIQIQGWALILGEEIESVNCNVMLIGEESGKQWILPTMVIERMDLTEAFSDGTDYSKAGFLANIRRERLSLEKEDYRIYLEYLTNGHSYLVPTEKRVRAIREILWQETDNTEAGISFLVDSVTAKKKVLTIEGWLFCQKDLEKVTRTEVLLLNSRTGRAYLIPTDKIERLDIVEHFSENTFSNPVGFTASLETWRFDFGYDSFEICLRYTSEDEVSMIHTGQYVNLEEQGEEYNGS